LWGKRKWGGGGSAAFAGIYGVLEFSGSSHFLVQKWYMCIWLLGKRVWEFWKFSVISYSRTSVYTNFQNSHTLLHRSHIYIYIYIFLCKWHVCAWSSRCSRSSRLHMDESCRTRIRRVAYEGVMSRMNGGVTYEWMRHVTYQCHVTYEWMSHVTYGWMSHLTYERMSHVTYEWMSHGTQVLERPVAYKWVMSHKSVMSRMNEWVMSHRSSQFKSFPLSHPATSLESHMNEWVTSHMNESCHTGPRALGHFPSHIAQQYQITYEWMSHVTYEWMSHVTCE